MKNIEVSIVIPVMNEVDNIDCLAKEITKVMEEEQWVWECLWIDDFSNDGTRDELKKLHHREKCHQYIFHTSNYGQSATLATGFRYCSGSIIVTIDGDRQNDPQNIPALVRKLIDENADMVNGWREKRQDNLIRKISSRIANRFRNRITGESIKDVGCALRAFRRECINNIPLFKGMHRFLPTLIRIGGFNKILEIPVNHRPRIEGKTKYGINNRLWVGIIDTLAVLWMRKRTVLPETSEISIKK